MLTDARTLTDGTRLEADVCVVGAGAAGIAFAREWLGHDAKLLLLESGGFTPEPEVQALYDGESVGHAYFPLNACRLRYFGGTTNHWAGFSRRLDAADFAARSWIPDSGWPFQLDTLAPYYQRAEPIIELEPGRYDAEFWQQRSALPTLPLTDDSWSSRVFQLSPPTRFGIAYREELEQAQNVQLVLHANAVGIRLDADGTQTTELQVATLDGKRLVAHARYFVLATGGIEIPRLLLASRPSSHANGIGNGNDLVGRYFLEHPHLVDGLFLPSDPNLDASFYSGHYDQGFIGTLNLNDEVVEREALNRISVTLIPTPRQNEKYLDAESSQGLVSLKHLKRALKHREVPEDFVRHLWNMLKELDEVALASYGRARGVREDGNMYKVFFRTEQAPNRDSRVRLGEARDAMGMPRAQLDWKISDQELRSIERGHELFGQALGAAGLGRLFFPKDDPEQTWIRGLFGGNHHMGTTRMHSDPKQGVVDPDCRVHGIANLYVASSAVFPTTGYANPTLTILALALRLSDHLKGKLA